MRSARDGLGRWRPRCAPEGGTVGHGLLGARSRGGDELPAAGAGSDRRRRTPRASVREAEYELLLEMIHEGSRLHYGGPRVVGDDDPDLALLLGDQLYALGLARLAELGDLDAVAELADLISLLAQAQAEAGRSSAGRGGLEAGATRDRLGPRAASTRRPRRSRGPATCAQPEALREPRRQRRGLVTPASLLTVRFARRSIRFSRR